MCVRVGTASGFPRASTIRDVGILGGPLRPPRLAVGLTRESFEKKTLAGALAVARAWPSNGTECASKQAGFDSNAT